MAPKDSVLSTGGNIGGTNVVPFEKRFSTNKQASITGSGDGGGSGMEKRIQALESSVGKIIGFGITFFLFILAGIGGLYLHTDTKFETVNKDIAEFRIHTTKEFGAIRLEMADIKTDLSKVAHQNELILQTLKTNK